MSRPSEPSMHQGHRNFLVILVSPFLACTGNLLSLTPSQFIVLPLYYCSTSICQSNSQGICTMRYGTSSISITGSNTSNMHPPSLGHCQRGVGSCPPPTSLPSDPPISHTHIHFYVSGGVLLGYNNLLWKPFFGMDHGFIGAK